MHLPAPTGTRSPRLAVATATAVALALAGCSNASDSSPSANASPVGVTCDDVLGVTIGLIRAGQPGKGDDPLTTGIELLRTGCPEQYQVFADYASASGISKSLGVEACSKLAGDISPEAIRLLREDKYCTGGGGAPRRDTVVKDDDDDAGSIAWNEAAEHVGTTQRVCGPFAGTGRSSDDVFVNLGLNYPDPDRFTIVLWDVGSVETPAIGRTVCASGRITTYQGVAQIELRSSGSLQVTN